MIRRAATAFVAVMALLILMASVEDVSSRTETNWSSK